MVLSHLVLKYGVMQCKGKKNSMHWNWSKKETNFFAAFFIQISSHYPTLEITGDVSWLPAPQVLGPQDPVKRSSFWDHLQQYLLCSRHLNACSSFNVFNNSTRCLFLFPFVREKTRLTGIRIPAKVTLLQIQELRFWLSAPQFRSLCHFHSSTFPSFP